MTAPVEVVLRVGDCPCPGTPHTEEHVYLEPTLTLPMAITAYAAMRQAGTDRARMEGALVSSYFPASIRAWTFTDDEGKLVPINDTTFAELVPWYAGGYELADRADGLYSEQLMRPLVGGRSKSSPAGSTETSTSASPVSGSRLPKRSRQSLRNGQAGKPSVALVR